MFLIRFLGLTLFPRSSEALVAFMFGLEPQMGVFPTFMTGLVPGQVTDDPESERFFFFA